MMFILTLLLSVISIVKSSEPPIFAYNSIRSEFNIYDVCKQLIDTNELVYKGCRNQVEIVCNNTALLWTMFDASSKFPYTGISYASKIDLGNFDECLTIDHFENGTRVLGKHCAFGFILPTTTNTTDITNLINTAFKLSMCIPDACSAKDLLNIFGIPINVPIFNDAYCMTKETAKIWKYDQIIILVIFSVFGVFMILSTTYDIYLHYKQLKSRHPLLIAFSCLTNGSKLLKTTKGTKDQIMTFNGLKFISMMWIIAGHNFGAWKGFPLTNDDDGQNWLNQRYAVYINAAHISVDTFFYISGFLLAYMYFKEEPKPLKVHINRVPYLYLHRYLRLTPALLMTYLFLIGINAHIATGPIYKQLQSIFVDPCQKYWWSFFLYIQNYYNYDEFCLTQTWYLSADMQMFIFSPIVVIPIAIIVKKNFNVAMVLMLVINLVFTLLPLATKLIWRDYTNEYDTHSRFIDYFMGFFLGLYMRERKDEPFKFSSIMNLIIWIIILTGMFVIVNCYQEVEMNHGYVSKSVFYSLMRPAWCIGLSWIVYSCHKGYGGPVNSLLSHPVFQVGSKLVYCMYLMHSIVVVDLLMQIRTFRYFNDYIVFYDWCGAFIVTLIVATLWTLAFESPIIIIEKFLFGHGKKETTSHKAEEPNQRIE